MNPSKQSTLIVAVVAGAVLIVVATVCVTMMLSSSPSKEVIVAPAAPPPMPAPAAVQQAKADLAVAGLPAQAQQPPPPRSPYSDLRWRGSVAEVKVNGTWYELAAINNVPADKIIDLTRQHYGDPWKQRFVEDLGEVLDHMNSKLGDTANLQLKQLDDAKVVTLADVPVTAKNAATIRPQFAGGSPFSGVRWNGNSPQVQVQGAWFDLVSLDDVPADQIVQFAITTYGAEDRGDQPMWKKRFSEDLGQVMSKMRHDLGQTVKLRLRNLKTSEELTMNDVELTEANRDAILAERGVINPR